MRKQVTTRKAETVAKHLKPHGKKWANRGARRVLRKLILGELVMQCGARGVGHD